MNNQTNFNKITQIPSSTQNLPRLSIERYAVVFKKLKQMESSDLFNEADFLSKNSFQEQLDYLKDCCHHFAKNNPYNTLAAMSAIEYGITLFEKKAHKKMNDHYIKTVDLAKEVL